MKNWLLLVLAFASHLALGQNLSGKLLYSVQSGGVDSLFALERDGKTLTYVTEGFRPRLSHNGKVLVFTRNHNSPTNSYGAAMWRRDLTNEADTVIFSQSDYLDYYDFMPNDKRLVYSATCAIYFTDLRGKNTFQNFACNPCDCYSDDPVVRVKDSLIAYHNVHYGLYTIKTNADSSQRIPHTYPGDLYPTWSPDGKWISYFTGQPATYYYASNNIIKIRPNGADSTRLTKLGIADTIVSDPVWAHDGGSIFFLARVSGVAGLYQVPTDGSAKVKLLKSLVQSVSIWKYTLGLADSLNTTYAVETRPRVSGPEVTLSPNPAQNQLIVQGAAGACCKWQITDILGRGLAKGELVNTKTLIDLKDLQAGSYILRVLGADGAATLKRFEVVR